MQPPTQLTAHHRGTRATLRLVTTAPCTPSSMLVRNRKEALCPRYVPPHVLVAGDCLNVKGLVLRRGKHVQTEIVLHKRSKLTRSHRLATYLAIALASTVPVVVLLATVYS